MEPNTKERLETVKKSYNSSKVLLQKTIEGLTLMINPKDTKDLDYGTYWYDIQLTLVDESNFTVVGLARFIMREEVTF